MKFKYQAKSQNGELQVGFVEAAEKGAAETILHSHGLFILSLQEEREDSFLNRILSYFNKVSAQDIMVFSRQLATMLEARLPLSNALRVLEEQTESPIMKEAVRQVSMDVSAGLTLSQALSRHPSIFSSFFVSMIQSAEVTGKLDEATIFLADYLEKENALVSKAKAAMIYPAVVLSLFIIVAGVMVTTVFPKLGPVFEQSGVKLPIYTRALLSIGSFAGQWWPVIIFVFGAFLLGTLNYFQTTEGRALLDDIKVRWPIIKKLYVPLTITRLSNVMSMLLKGGVPITQAVQIAGLTVNSSVYEELMNYVANGLEQGKPLSAALGDYPDYFPPLTSQMLVVGEATGQIDQMFLRISNYYGRQVDTVISNLVELIQPVLMIVIGGGVGLLFASLLIPLYSLTSSIQ
jgi:type IV pilus assembly protein PilC